jgi:hypothetical protein
MPYSSAALTSAPFSIRNKTLFGYEFREKYEKIKKLI